MRRLVTIGLLALAVPVFASDPGDPDPVFESPAWTGKHSDELIAEWGKPRKTKRHGEGGKVLVYRVRFLGKVGGNWCEVATQKVRFYLDAEGIVRGQESAPRKWKRKP